ncbi:hypothetical protein ACOMHN_026486 [Nucella lapillus]
MAVWGRSPKITMLRIRSFFFLLLFSVFCSFSLLTLVLMGAQLDSQALMEAENATLSIRPRSCNNCFHTDYRLLVNHPEICSLGPGQVVDVIFFIFTRPESVDTRAVIRNTWGSVTRNNTSNFRHVFVTGYTSDVARMRMLKEESRHFRDVVISEFIDSYNNLTLKTMTSLHWITGYCAHARFFFKVDDDVWLNTGRLLERFNQSSGLQRGLGGYCKMSSRVLRETSSKWYAPYASYPERQYPSYCSGVGYGGTITLARRLVEISKNVPFFYLEDVYMGLCLRELGVDPVHFEELSAHRGWDLCEAFSDRVMSYHMVPPWLMTRIWNLKSCRHSAFWRFLTLDFTIL